MPALIVKHQKLQAAAKLKKFYSTINQAVMLSEAENGEVSQWVFPSYYDQPNEEIDFLNTYLAKYIKHTKITACGGRILNIGHGSCMYFSDGTIMVFRYHDIILVLNSNALIKNVDGKNVFQFELFRPGTYHANVQRVEPATYTWNKDTATLRTASNYGCKKENSNSRVFCTMLIKLNGWEIPDDYPW
jgi:hypothetical protein